MSLLVLQQQRRNSCQSLGRPADYSQPRFGLRRRRLTLLWPLLTAADDDGEKSIVMKSVR